MKNTQEVELKIEWKVMEYTNIPQEQRILVNEKIVNKKEKECMSFLMVQFMTVNGKIIRCMVKDSL